MKRYGPLVKKALAAAIGSIIGLVVALGGLSLLRATVGTTDKPMHVDDDYTFAWLINPLGRQGVTTLDIIVLIFLIALVGLVLFASEMANEAEWPNVKYGPRGFILGVAAALVTLVAAL